MKRRVFIYLLLFCALPLFADAVLDDFIQKMEQQTLETAFTLNISAQGTSTFFRGELRLHGERFAVSFMEQEMAYDGKTLYVYQSDLEELTLTEPTAEECMEVNPLLLTKALSASSEIKRQDVNGMHRITLTPTVERAGIERITLMLIAETLLPKEIVVREADGNMLTMTFDKPIYTTTVPSFTIHKENVIINDLR